ncbi:MAG: gamma-glutamyltransferase [Deltaproteobacteria bacterium RIFCSPLOWO2_12_FULL_57_22]|nr:MAG: gamma-glutamyltransferase [Deltaproteobacteria bacterium RIFCSPLOWO2_12_FULL_57_22]
MIFARAGRPVVMGRHGMVCSGHHLASLSGIKVLQEGGNAVDAALATAFTLAVVRPHSCGPGGDLFALVFMRNPGKVEALNASGAAPKKAAIELFRDRGLVKIPADGPLSIAVPGAVDGWVELHRKYGSFELPRLAADAIRYAREGFALYPALAKEIDELGSSYPWIDRCYRKPLQGGSSGTPLVQPELARTLELLATKGREIFYQGELGARVCSALEAAGGLLSEEDLQGKHAEWLEPLSTTYRGFTVFEQPPVSQGFMVLEMLNIIEGYPLSQMDPVEAIHVMVEAKKLAFADRINHLEDPRFGDPQVARLISKEHARNRRTFISTIAREQRHITVSLGTDTTYLCAIDGEGNAVSLIQSIFASFGSRVVAGDTGVTMNNRLCSFVLDAGKANALRPGKRPAHTLNSYMVFRDGGFFAVGGSPGADDQPQTNLQLLHHLLDRNLDPQTVIEAPRWSHKPGTPPRSEGPEDLSLEEGFAADHIEGLRKKGHKVKVVNRWSFGGAALIVREPVTGTLMAGADPRREGYALGW